MSTLIERETSAGSEGARRATGDPAGRDAAGVPATTPESDRKRLVWALLVTLGFSRHQYVHVNFSQKLDVVIDGLEEAWEFFGRCA